MPPKTQKGTSSKQRKMSARMERFVDRVVQEAEEAGIDDHHAAEEARERAAVGVTSSSAASRHRRQPSA